MLVTHVATLTATRLAQYYSLLPYAAAGSEGDRFLLIAVSLHNGFGWLAAFIAFGLVFPHSTRQMRALVFGLAAFRLLTDAAVLLAEPAWLSALAYPMILGCQMMVTGLVMALFGSHRLHALEQKVRASRQEAQAARKLGPYALKRRLGAGGMGEVFLAEHRLLKRPCAVKLIHPDQADDLLAQARFDREVQATASLKHPNTVEVFDYGRTEQGTFYYVMEYLDGLSLENLVCRSGPLPAARVVHILLQLSGALKEAHRQNFIHRDIKPSNILLCRRGGLYDVVKLVDFGLALRGVGPSSKLTRSGILMGTPDYIAPEQADGSGADARSDLYSVGATAYFLLTGSPPYQCKSVLDVLIAHRHQSLPELATAAGPDPQDLEMILRRCLAKSPEERFAHAADLERALRRCAEKTPWSEVEAQAWWDQADDELAAVKAMP
jgi:serine/threonine-protein kinase